MALSTNIYAEITTTFPANVIGSGAITVAKSGGVYTIGYDEAGVPVNSIGNDKMAQVAARRLIGNPSGAAADRSEISLGGDLEFSGTMVQCVAFTGDIAKSAGSSVTTITAGAVGATQLADGSATGPKIGPDAIDGTKIADASVDSEHYVDASIDAAHIANDQIESQHYAAASIDAAHIADEQIDSQHYVAASIDHEHLGDDVITGAANRTAFESGDKLLIHETGVGLRKIDFDDLPAGGGAAASGAVLQSVYGEYSTHLSGQTNGFPIDASVPQNTEGVQILSTSITPAATANKLRIRYSVPMGSTTAGWVIGAVFRDADASAIGSSLEYCDTGTAAIMLVGEFEFSPATTSAVTIKLRVGSQSGKTYYVNGSNSVAYLGASLGACLIVEEIKA